MIVKDLGGTEKTLDIEIEISLTLGTKVRREGVITAKSQDMIQVRIRRRKWTKLSKESKTHRWSR